MRAKCCIRNAAVHSRNSDRRAARYFIGDAYITLVLEHPGRADPGEQHRRREFQQK
jgi:hypothetical protein